MQGWRAVHGVARGCVNSTGPAQGQLEPARTVWRRHRKIRAMIADACERHRGTTMKALLVTIFPG